MTKKNELQVYDPRSLQVQDAAWNALSDNSKAAYKSDFDLFFRFIGNKPAKEVTASDVLSFIDHLKEEGYKNSSINRKIASLSKMFRVLKIAREIEENPVDLLKEFKNINFKINKTARNILSMKEIQKAIEITKDTTAADKKLILIIRALAKTGLRISELLNIKYKDMEKYDAGTMSIRVIGKGNKERFIFLENSFIKEIQKEFPKHECDFLFYTHNFKMFDRREVWRSFKNFFQKRIGKHVHPHMLRHTFATFKIFEEKQDVKAVSSYLGHSSTSITQDIYNDSKLDTKTAKVKI